MTRVAEYRRETSGLSRSVWHARGMPMREDCRHFESPSYDDGETARFCVLDLAPEQPWRCPDDCAKYQPTLIDSTFEEGSLARPAVEEEPEESAEAISDLLNDAEMIVEDAEPTILRELGGARNGRRKWWQFWKRRPPKDGDDWHLSSR